MSDGGSRPWADAQWLAPVKKPSTVVYALVGDNSPVLWLQRFRVRDEGTYFQGGGVRLDVRFCILQSSPSLSSITVQKPLTGPCGDVCFHDPDDHLTAPSMSQFDATITRSFLSPSLKASPRRFLTAAGPS